MTTAARLDHVVINVGFEMDRAAARFAELGFHLTERGHHSLGSINHLAILGSDYLELIGLPAGAGPGRPDIANAAIGINGLVFKTDDVDATYAHLQRLGMAGAPPNAFNRPVRLPEGERLAAFRTVHVRPDVFPGGRVYFCQHETPELVWRPEWRRHENGARAIAEFVAVAREAEAEAAAFARLLGAEAAGGGGAFAVPLAGARLSVLTPAAYAERYGGLASGMGARPAIFGALVFATGGLAPARALAAGLGDAAPALDEPARLVLREPRFDSVLEFIE